MQAVCGSLAAVTQVSWEWRKLAEWQADAPGVYALEATELPSAGSTLLGRCPVCDGALRFEFDGQPVELREGLHCGHCRSNARQRAAALVLLGELRGRNDPRVYITEQTSMFYVALKRRLPRLTGSEYERDLRFRYRMSRWLWREGIWQLLRFGDLTALWHRTASLDAVLTLDVLEHVPDHRKALRECARVLRRGGALVVTVPFYDGHQSTQALARMTEDGRIEHLAEPEYHGDPLSDGVLCFHHFGWDLLEDMRAAGFTEVSARRVHSRDAAVLQGQWVLIARR